MGRTRSFDETETVRAARELFWQRGYDETGLSDLEGATGLNRSSIYHSFGSKRGLFAAAVDSYLTEIVYPRWAELRSEPVPVDALHNYLVGLRAALLERTTTFAANGCLLLNTTGSLLGHEASLQDVAGRYCAELRANVAAGVAAARPQLDAREQELLVTTCTGLVFAAMSIVRLDRDAAAGMIDAALAALALTTV